MPRTLQGGGRSVPPAFVETTIQRSSAAGTAYSVIRDGVQRTVYTAGGVQVITEDAGNIVVTVLRL